MAGFVSTGLTAITSGSSSRGAEESYVTGLYQGFANVATEIAARIQQFVDDNRSMLFFVATSGMIAFLDPTPFFSGMAAGFLGNVVIELIHDIPLSGHSFFLDHTYETSIIQSAMVAVHVACQILHVSNLYTFAQSHRDGVVGSTFSGIIAGATLAAYVRRVYSIMVGRV